MITNNTIGRYGRFANGMFQIAAVIGIARKSGHGFGFHPWMNYDHAERFGSPEDIDLQKYFVNPLPLLNDPAAARTWKEVPYQWGYHEINLHPGGNYNITGHFQSEKYFSHCIDEVRHYFKMKDEEAPGYHYDKVQIHVRRGDYDNRYHTILTSDYYYAAMKQFPKDTNFIVFTDDKEACYKMFGDTVSYSGEKDYINDFCFMKQCGGFICANSSFSLMAAILSEAPNKKIVCPSNWFGPAWKPDTKDLYPENAIII